MTAQLTQDQKRMLNYCEQCFWQHGTIPTSERISETLGININAVRRNWDSVLFRTELASRGIDLDPDRSKGILSGQQLLLANMLLNSHDKRSTRQKLKDANITETQYNAWLRDPGFSKYLRDRAETIFQATDADAYMALADVVKGGDVPAIKLFFEMRGIYNPKIDVNVNIEAVLVRVVEIVAKHVKEPAVLEAIAVELEMIAGLPGVVSLPVQSSPGGFSI